MLLQLFAEYSTDGLYDCYLYRKRAKGNSFLAASPLCQDLSLDHIAFICCCIKVAPSRSWLNTNQPSHNPSQPTIPVALLSCQRPSFASAYIPSTLRVTLPVKPYARSLTTSTPTQVGCNIERNLLIFSYIFVGNQLSHLK
jgi:hypothetical protein